MIDGFGDCQCGVAALYAYCWKPLSGVFRPDQATGSITDTRYLKHTYNGSDSLGNPATFIDTYTRGSNKLTTVQIAFDPSFNNFPFGKWETPYSYSDFLDDCYALLSFKTLDQLAQMNGSVNSPLAQQFIDTGNPQHPYNFSAVIWYVRYDDSGNIIASNPPDIFDSTSISAIPFNGNLIPLEALGVNYVAFMAPADFFLVAPSDITAGAFLLKCRHPLGEWNDFLRNVGQPYVDRYCLGKIISPDPDRKLVDFAPIYTLQIAQVGSSVDFIPLRSDGPWEILSMTYGNCHP